MRDLSFCTGPSTTRLVATLHRNDRFATWLNLYRTQVKYCHSNLLLPTLGLSSKKVWAFMSAMQNNFYCIRLHATFTGDEYLASCIATVILKEKPALSKTQQTTVQIAEIGQMLFERCTSCCCSSVKSEFFCPRYLDEKLFEANFA